VTSQNGHSDPNEQRIPNTTTDAGIPAASDDHSLTVGADGPILLQDHYVIQKMQAFNRERVPERVVHAKGGGAFGYFEVTADVREWTKAAFLNTVGKRTPVAIRFSTVAGEQGSADTVRDPRVQHKTLWEGSGLHGGFAFAVVAEGSVIGVLTFSSQAVREPDQRLVQAARVIGSQIGQFLKRKQAEESQRESELRFRSLVQMSSDFFWETDAQDRFTEMVHGPNYVDTVAGAGEAGWGELRGMFQARLPFRDFEFGRPWRDGSIRYFSVSGEPRFAAEGAFLGYRGVGRDITEIALARERIASLAYSDPLTGLANRTSLSPALEQAVERARRRGAKLAGVFMDLDGFKQVNDAHGHDIGDGLLVEVARRLRTVLRASDFVARLGGDEFFVVIEEVHDVPAVDGIARKLLSELLEPYELAGGKRAQITASLGVSVFPDDAGDAQTLMKHADMAMYAAKEAGKNSYRFYPVEPVGEATYERTNPSAA